MKKIDCIFCRIAKKEILSDLVYENKKFFVFLDICPVSHGHLLIIPKKHIVWMQDADDKMISDIFKLTKKTMLIMKKALKCDYVQLGVAGTEVPHFHVHLVPRYFNDDLPKFPTKTYKDGETGKIKKKLLKHFNPCQSSFCKKF